MRLTGIDLLRGIAAFGIVGCHLMLYPATRLGNELQWLCDFNVAVFAVLAGYMMSAKNWDEPYGVYALKRVRRLLPLYLVWSLIFVLFSFGFKVFAHESLAQYYDWVYWVSVLLQGNASCHLWFLVCLLYTQLGLRVVPRTWLKTVVLFLVAFALIVVASSWRVWSCKYFLRLIGFVVFGVGLRCFGIEKHYRISVGMVLLGLALIVRVVLGGYVPNYVLDLMAVGPTVLVFATLPQGGMRMQKLSGILAATSMGVFLIHPMITRIGGMVCRRFCAPPFSAAAIVLDWVTCWLVAFVLTGALLKIPALRRILN